MAKTNSLTRKQNHDDGDASRRKRAKTRGNSGVSHWSCLNNDVLFLVIMKLGVVDFVSFSGVCKSWRSFALRNRDKFMASTPPMLTWFHKFQKKYYFTLEDFEGRKFKTLLSCSSVGIFCVGLTCGYFVFYEKKLSHLPDFWLVNPITRHELHFPGFPCFRIYGYFKPILVFSPSISSWVFVILSSFRKEIWISIAGKGSWNDVSCNDSFFDIHVFKGKIYTLNYGMRLYELILNPKPKLSILEIEKFGKQYTLYEKFVSSDENLYVCDPYKYPKILYELDFEEMKWVSRDEKLMGEYAFFLSDMRQGVAIQPESWAVDPRSKYKTYESTDEIQKGRFFNAPMWYFPHLCLDVDYIDE